MKLNSKLALLALALTTGIAGAAAPVAGSSITNQATADFQVTDPTNNNITNGSSASNQVSTVITAVPSYTITPNSTQTNTVVANSTSSFNYVVTNTGNTPVKVVLTSLASPAATLATTSGSTTSDATLQGDATNGYYVVVNPGQVAKVTQSYQVAGPGTYSQNLTGTGYYDPANGTNYTTDYTDTTKGITNIDSDNANTTTVSSATSAIPGSPATDTTKFPADPSNPNLNNNANPGTTTPATGTGYVQPAGPTVPGGTATLPGAGTPVSVAPDGSQTAYPKADSNGNPDVVSMTGTAPNKSGVSDNITVGPAGSPATLINPATGQAFVNGQVPVDINGNPIPGATVTVNPDGSVTFNNVPNGAAPAYTVQVTYPDAGPNTSNPAITVTVPIHSGNAGYNPADPAGTANNGVIATPTYTVKQPGLDLKVVAQDSGTTLDNSNQTIKPSATATTNADFTTTVTNNGSYSDTFNITSGTNKLPDGATVQYLLNGTPLKDTNGDGIVDTGVLAPGETVNLTTRVVLPANAVAGTDYSVVDVATGAFSTITDTDGTIFAVGVVDPVTPPTTPITDPSYTSNPLFPMNKTVQKDNGTGALISATTADPGDTLVYTIKATNKYNAPACNVVLTEADGTNTNVFANSTFQRITGTSSVGTVLFSTSKTGPWSATTLPAGSTSVYAGLDTNADGGVTNDDCLPIGGTINLTMTTKVNK